MILKREDIYKGNLILVNKNTPIKNGTEDEIMLTPIDPYLKDITLELGASVMLSQLMSSINCQGEIIPVSGFRTCDEQRDIYRESLRANGADFTSRYVAMPNHSEHQTGLAIDLAYNLAPIDLIRPQFLNNGICETFRKAAPKYGFVERYSKGKERVTGIAYEPWHFRYVGSPHALVMRDNSLALEEYIDFIKEFSYEKNSYVLDRSSSRLEIFYVKATAPQVEIKLPTSSFCQASGNNVDGFIITLLRGTA